MNKRDSTRTALVITHVPFEDLGSLGIELTHAGFNIQGIDAAPPICRRWMPWDLISW
jgi:hypothetical protein